MIVLTALSTLGGGLWAGFEFYKDYMDMKEIVQNIDIDAIAAENALVVQKIDESMLRVDEAIEYARDIKDDLRQDIMSIEDQVNRMDNKVDETVLRVENTLTAAENRIKDTQANIENTLEGIRNDMNQIEKDVNASIREVESLNRETEKDVRDTMRETEDRIDADMRQLETDLTEQLQEALDNPLNE